MSKRKSNLTVSCIHQELNRRAFLDRVLAFGVIGAGAALIPRTAAALTQAPPRQDNWRQCGKCRSLFFNGYRRGRCPGGRAHSGDNRNYKIDYNSPGPGQNAWRFCNKCDAMFFDGYPQKGVCPAGGGHFAQGYMFTLRFDSRAIGEQQWRFCNKCHVIFHNPESNQGVCAAGGGHVAAGYRFILDSTVPFD